MPQGKRVVRCLGCCLEFAEFYPDYDIADVEIYGDDYFKGSIAKQRKREGIFDEMVANVESVLGWKGRLLDVGAGDGALLCAAVDRGWEVEGTEIASVMIRYVREELGLTIHQGIIEDIHLPLAAFDAVILNHVLEHVRNPKTTLEKVASLIGPDGVVRIEVPNLAGLSARAKNFQSRWKLKRKPWKHYSTGHHFWFFTPKTLARTLESAGLAVISVDAPLKQWGSKNAADRFLNYVYKKTLSGGHLVVYARAQ
jgi:2-polyprenyl-3-methyl-5-hydroxy-6-metoxy-1,4-benzoquinol methylase